MKVYENFNFLGATFILYLFICDNERLQVNGYKNLRSLCSQAYKTFINSSVISTYVDECDKELGIPSLSSYPNSTELENYWKQQEEKCHAKCYLEKFNIVIPKDGSTPDVSEFIRNFPDVWQKEIRKNVGECWNVQNKTEPCSSFNNIKKCLYKSLKEVRKETCSENLKECVSLRSGQYNRNITDICRKELGMTEKKWSQKNYQEMDIKCSVKCEMNKYGVSIPEDNSKTPDITSFTDNLPNKWKPVATEAMDKCWNYYENSNMTREAYLQKIYDHRNLTAECMDYKEANFCINIAFLRVVSNCGEIWLSNTTDGARYFGYHY